MSLLIVWLLLPPWVNPKSSKLTMSLHRLQLLFSVSVRPIKCIIPLAFLIILKCGP
jgi:hypothetical protein